MSSALAVAYLGLEFCREAVEGFAIGRAHKVQKATIQPSGSGSSTSTPHAAVSQLLSARQRPSQALPSYGNKQAAAHGTLSAQGPPIVGQTASQCSVGNRGQTGQEAGPGAPIGHNPECGAKQRDRDGSRPATRGHRQAVATHHSLDPGQACSNAGQQSLSGSDLQWQSASEQIPSLKRARSGFTEPALSNVACPQPASAPGSLSASHARMVGSGCQRQQAAMVAPDHTRSSARGHVPIAYQAHKQPPNGTGLGPCLTATPASGPGNHAQERRNQALDHTFPSLNVLWNRINQYQKIANTLPPPRPAHFRCPGVFKHSVKPCGGALAFRVRHYEMINGSGYQAVSYYSCSNPECDYTEPLPDRKLLPVISCEATDASTFKIAAAVGAQEAVAYCGGLSWILQAVGCPLRFQVDPQGCSANEDALYFELTRYDDVTAPLKNQKRLRMTMLRAEGEISQQTRMLFRKPTQASDAAEVDMLLKNIPASLEKALMPFQRDGVLYGLRHRGRVLIGDEMGIGKTVQAIAIACAYKDEWPLLIVAPASLRLAWAEELERWLPHLRPSTIHVIQGKVDRMGHDFNPQVVIISYEMMMRLTCNCCCKGRPNMPGAAARCAGPEACMASRGFKVVIVDESHEMRTTATAPDSRHTEAVAATCKRSRRAILLSGTPSLSRPFDLFRQVDALRPGLVGRTREAFSLRYCNRRLMPVGKAEEKRVKYFNNGLSHACELHELLKQEVMVRRLKQDVMRELPPKRRQVIRLPAPRECDWPKQASGKDAGQEGIEDLEGEQTDHLHDTDGDEGEQSPQQSTNWSAAHKTAVAKLPNVIEWLAHVFANSTSDRSSTLAGNGQASIAPGNTTKMLLFAHHIDVMDSLAAALSGQDSAFPGAAFVRIDGSTDAIDRRAAVARFRDDPHISVALLSITAAGVGLDFSTASTVVFAELPQEVAHVRQAEDRAHRKGQHSPVNVYFLVAKSSADERRWQHLNSSLERVNAVHDGQASSCAHGEAGGGLLLNALHEVTASQGWIGQMTQRPMSGPSIHAGKAGMQKDADTVQPLSQADGKGFSSDVETACSEQPPVPLQEPEAGEIPASTHFISPAGKIRPQQSLPTTPTSEEGLERLLRELSARVLPGSRVQKPLLDEAKASTSPSAVHATSLLAAYFEVSKNTGRIHFHLEEDGSKPLGLSLPAELLSMSGTSGTINNLLEALDGRTEQTSHVGPAGVLAIPLHFGGEEIASMVREARSFVGEWMELRAVTRNRLLGFCLRPPLQDAAEAAMAQAREDGAFGSSSNRYLTSARDDLKLPAGATWQTVKVKYYSRTRLVEHQQPFLLGRRLCCLCAGPIAWCDLPKTAILNGASALFCGPACETKYCLRSNNGLIRRELFRLERGVCQKCKLDCLALIKALRAIEKGGNRWEFLRKQKLLLMAPAWGARGATKAATRLVNTVLEGNAWQADHIVPVYQGGGLCDLDNFRTLCTVCHQEVTKLQSKHRAELRKSSKQHKLGDLLDGFDQGLPKELRTG